MSFCNKAVTPLQRRSLQKISGVMGLTVAVSVMARSIVHGSQPSRLITSGIAVMSAVPVIFAIVVVSRYLRAEEDEFIRNLLVRALLWGIGVTLAGDAIAGTLMEYHVMMLPLALLNADVFLVSTGLSFRLLQRSYR